VCLLFAFYWRSRKINNLDYVKLARTAGVIASTSPYCVLHSMRKKEKEVALTDVMVKISAKASSYFVE
jgi:hypothetical protein